MRRRFIAAALAAVFALTGAAILAPSAEAVTWTYLGWTTDSDDVVCNTTLIGSVTVGMGWERSNTGLVRVAAHPTGHHAGISLSNFTNRDLTTDGNHQIYQTGGFTYQRRWPPSGADNWLSAVINNKTFPAATTSYIATDNATWSPFGPSSGGFAIDQDPFVEVFGGITGCSWTSSWLIEVNNPAA